MKIPAEPRPQVRGVRHCGSEMDFLPVVQILDAPVPQLGAYFPAVLEQVIVQPLPAARVVEPVALVRVSQTSFPSVVVPPTGLQDRTDRLRVRVISAEEVSDEECDEEEEEEEVEMFDNSIDRFEHSRFRPRRLCVCFMSGSCEEGWSCTFAHSE